VNLGDVTQYAIGSTPPSSVRGSALVWVPICVITFVSAATLAMILASWTVLVNGF
jgi:hypothetical protein